MFRSGGLPPPRPYTADFLRQLARSGKIRAFKLNRDWLTTPDAIRDYLKTQTERHEKALSVLQSAHKAFLALSVLLIVFSVTPKVHAGFFGDPNGGTTTITYNPPASDPRVNAKPLLTEPPSSTSGPGLDRNGRRNGDQLRSAAAARDGIRYPKRARIALGFSAALAQTLSDLFNLPRDIAANVSYVQSALVPPLDYTASLLADSFRLGQTQLNQVSAQLATNIENGKPQQRRH